MYRSCLMHRRENRRSLQARDIEIVSNAKTRGLKTQPLNFPAMEGARELQLFRNRHQIHRAAFHELFGGLHVQFEFLF